MRKIIVRVLLVFSVIACLGATSFAAQTAQPVYPGGIKPNLPFSPAVKFGDLLFMSGQIPYIKGAIPAYARDGVEDIQDQTKIVMENLKAVLAAADMTFDNVLKTTVFLSDMSHYRAFNKVYAQYWASDEAVPPAREVVEIATLPGGRPGAPVLVEISMIAGKEADPSLAGAFLVLPEKNLM